jgi:hypothetical protein
MSNPYCIPDAREEANSLRGWQDDLLTERLAGELLDDPELLASAIADLDEDAKPTQRLAKALYALYHDHQQMSPEIMLLRTALYGVIKQHCKAVVGKF